MECVRLDGVSKVYDNGFVAVRPTDLVVEEGEFVVLVGPSGCGKSTMLRMIAGLESISQGLLHIGGRLVNDVAPKDRDIAMVFQNYALYPHLTVYENIAFGLKLRKHPRKDIEERVTAAAELLGLSDILGSRPKELSGGQRQRVAVGRAIVRKPRVFLFDEPLSNLDAKLRVQMRAEIRALHRRLGTTMIYVTHDQVEAMTMGDRIAVMRGGIIEQIDTPLELYDRPANRFVAGFIGSPSMSFFEGSMVSSSGTTRFVERGGGVTLALSAAQAAALGKHRDGLVLGVRPEDITVVQGAGDWLSDLNYGDEASEKPSARAPQDAPPAVSLVPDLVEQMGNEMVLHATSSTGPLVARIARCPLPGPTIPVGFVFDREKLHFFDLKTGARIPGSPG